MKKILSLMAATTLLLASCTPEETVPVTEYKPILVDRAELTKSVKMESVRDIENPGKIYRNGNMLFINEKYEGVHVIDNTDPTNPTKLGFIKIIGNVDIAMTGNIMYADNAVDLITLRYEGAGVTVLDREENVFPEPVAPDWGSIPEEFSEANRPANTVIVKWVKK
jgi:uncharacterized lipoprotein YajG